MEKDNILQTAITAVRESGKILKLHFGKILAADIQEKEKNDFLTYVDRMSEQKIIEVIRTDFPNHSILAEESGKNNKDKEYCWIIDPLDGTTNYINNIPIFAISVACFVTSHVK